MRVEDVGRPPPAVLSDPGFPPVGFSDRLGSILSHSKVMVELVLSNGGAKLHSHDK